MSRPGPSSSVPVNRLRKSASGSAASSASAAARVRSTCTVYPGTGLASPSVTQLHDLTALEQAAAVRTGEVSPTELVEHSLARIEALDAGLGAFITVTPGRALDAAAGAEALLRA